MQRAQVAQPVRQAAADGFEQDVHHPAATLPQRRAEGETPGLGFGRLAEQPGRDVGALMFELPAADRTDRLARRDDHLRAGFARRRTADAGDGHQHGAVPGSGKVGQFVDPLVHDRTAPIARSTASGVAGRSSAGSGLPSVAMASRIACSTEIASISGGSPTALER